MHPAQHNKDNKDNTMQRRGILDLPEDVLRCIFDYFKDDDLYRDEGTGRQIWPSYRSDRKDPEDANFKTVRSLRLVCRLLEQLASPLLVPVLGARISAESLRRVDGLTRNSHIAAGVRLVQVFLDYRPREMAQSLDVYRRNQRWVVRNLQNSCWQEVQPPQHATSGPRPQGEALLEQERRISDARCTYREMLRAWGACYDQSDEKHVSYEKLLRQCYEEYRDRHEEQYRMLTDGSFAGALAAAISRMPSLQQLSFVDHWERERPAPPMAAVAMLDNDFEKLRQLLVAPRDWQAIENMDPTLDILPARLLWELPIAIHERGKQLRELLVTTLPNRGKCDMMMMPSPRDVERLRAACRFLQRVIITRTHRWSMYYLFPTDMPAEKRAGIDTYLAAVLSGPNVERVDMDLRMVCDKLYPIGSVLAAVRWPRLRCLELRYASFRQEELEAFFGNLGGRMESILFVYVGVVEGGWARPLDVLRGRLSRHGSPGKCRVKFLPLRGGGCGGLDDEGLNAPGRGQPSRPPYRTQLYREAEMYVTGAEGMANPLAEVESMNEQSSG